VLRKKNNTTSPVVQSHTIVPRALEGGVAMRKKGSQNSQNGGGYHLIWRNEEKNPRKRGPESKPETGTIKSSDVRKDLGDAGKIDIRRTGRGNGDRGALGCSIEKKLSAEYKSKCLLVQTINRGKNHSRGWNRGQEPRPRRITCP